MAYDIFAGTDTAKPTAPAATPAAGGGSFDIFSGKVATPKVALAPAKIAPVDTSGIFSSFKMNNAFPTPKVSVGNSTPTVTDTNVLSDFNKAPKVASDAISTVVNTPIQAAADVLGNTQFMQQAAAGIDQGSEAGAFAESLVHKLSYGLEGISGVTGQLYKAPDNPTQDTNDKVVKTLANGLGMAVGMSKLGKLIPTAGAVRGFTSFVQKYPLVAKYAGPFIKPLVENIAGFAAYGQLDPALSKEGEIKEQGSDYTIKETLADDLHNRVVKLGTDIATAPLYTALGMIKNAGISIPASFGLGYGMAKLSGADNQDALAAGFALSFMDAAGRVGQTRGLTAAEVNEKIQNEALKQLNVYSKTKLTADSSPTELKDAYHRALFQVHPDVGGSNEAFIGIKNAYDVLSKGEISKSGDTLSAPEESMAQLKGEVQDTIAKHGEDMAHMALKDNLGVDSGTADRLVRAAKVESNPEKAAKKLAADLAPTEDGDVYYHGANEETAAKIKEHGFKPSEDFPGHGMVSLAGNVEGAKSYAQFEDGKGEVFTVKVNGTNVKTYDSMSDYTAALEAAPGKTSGEKETNLNSPYDKVIVKDGESAGKDAIFAKADKIEIVPVEKPQGDVPVEPVKKPKAKTEVVLTPKESSEKRAKENMPALVDEYIQKYGNEVNTDNARELFPEYAADRSLSSEVHEAASSVAKEVFNKQLADNVGKGNNTVLFTAGGTGAGKSASVKSLGNPEEFPVIYDGNANSIESISEKIDAAIKRGYNVEILYVHNDIETSLDNALERSTRMEKELGSGRTVPLDEHINTHVGAAQTFPELAKKYAKNKKVDFYGVNNAGNKAEPKVVQNPVDFVKEQRYTQSHEELHAKLEERIRTARKEGRISARTEKGFLGDRTDGRKLLEVSEGGEDAEHSVDTHETVYHGTTPEKAAKIRAEGFKGERAFVTTDRTEALDYTKGEGTETNPEGVVAFRVKKGTPLSGKEGKELFRGETAYDPKDLEILPATVEDAEPVLPKQPEAKVVLEGETPKLAERIQERLGETFEDVELYEKMDMKAEAKLAAEIMEKDYEQLKRIAFGIEAPPEGLHVGTAFKAVEMRAVADGDVETLRQLALSKTAKLASSFGQEIKAFDGRDPNSPVEAIAGIAKAREKAAEKKLKKGTTLKKEKAKIVSEVKEKIKKKATKQTWTEFVDSITC